ncbi:hypothetical protein BGZ76_011164 [Entomortierella beljakovae]|nr:hypothetical protein BGZ76_011164 [Entomortierella beljakovae]
MKESLKIAIEEGTSGLKNLQYFQQTIPQNYNALDSVKCPSLKLLQNLVFKGSEVTILHQTGRRLENDWVNEKKAINEIIEEEEKSRAINKYKRDVVHAYQEHRVKIMQRSSQTLDKDLDEYLNENNSSTSCSTQNDLKAKIPGNSTQTIGGGTIQRATKARIDAAHQLILITTAHFTRHLARLSKMPSQTEPLELPQTQHLDEQTRTLDLRRKAEEASQQEEYRTIEVMIEGVILHIRVKIHSLREALNLPHFDLNGLASFKYDIVLPPDEDMEDIDHADDE